MASEAEHPHVHLPAAAHDRHVRRHRSVDERAAAVDERDLFRPRQIALEMERARRDLHSRTLPFGAVLNTKAAKKAKTAKKKMLRAVCALYFLCLLCATPAVAHPAPFSYVDLRLQPGIIQGSVVAHIFDVAHDLDIANSERLLDPAFAAQQSRALAALLTPRLTVSADGQALAPEWSEIDVIPDRQSLRIQLRYLLTGAPGRVAVDAKLFPYDPAHQTFLNLYDGDALTQAILDLGHSRFEYFAGTRQGAIAVMRQFVPAGVK